VIRGDVEDATRDQCGLRVDPILAVYGIAEQAKPEGMPVRRPEMAQDILG
jgi:hypothetical protein